MWNYIACLDLESLAYKIQKGDSYIKKDSESTLSFFLSLSKERILLLPPLNS